MPGSHAEPLDRPALTRLQGERLAALLDALLPANRFYAAKFAAAGLTAADVRAPADLARLPFTTKEEVVADQAAHPPYGTRLTFPPERYVRLHQTSGTSSGRPLRCLDTPGHAMHHHCIWDEASRAFFTGDTFGLSYRDFDTALGVWIMPTTTPVQFQPEALRRSIERMLAFAPAHMHLTHFGRVGDVPRLGALLLAQLDEVVAFARTTQPGPERHDLLVRGLEAIHLASLRAHGVTLADAHIRELLALDLELNAQGLAIWLDRRKH